MVNYEFTLYTFEYFLMIMVRLASFIHVAPFFSMNNTPGRAKIGFSFIVSILLYQMILPKSPLQYSGIFDYTIIVVKEGITGLLIGFAANICNSIILFAGKIIDMDIGLAMAQIMDPVSNTMSGISGNLYNYFILMLLVTTNMHHYILRALIDSYTLIPINGAVFRWDHLLVSITAFFTDLMVIGFRIVLPVFACIMILNCMLGIMVKVSPQMNMFSIGMQLKIMVGLVILFLTVVLLPSVANFIFVEMKKMIIAFIEGMY